MKVGTIMESKDATFFEDIFPMKDMQSTSRQESEETPEPAIPMEYYEQTHDENPEEDDEESSLVGARDKGLQSPLVMISLCTSWMILPLLFQKLMHLQMLTTGRMQSVARWIPSWLMGHGRSLNVLMVANHWDVSGCSKRSLGLTVLLKSTRLGLWPRVIPRKKKKISSILIHLWPD